MTGPQRPAFSGRSGAATAGAIFLLALAVRLLHLVQIRATPFFTHPIVDAKMYDELAVSIAGGELLGSGVFTQAPLYPYFLALVYRVVGHDYFLARLVQVAVGAANCCLVCAVGRRVFNERTGMLAGVAAALYGTLVFYDAELLRPALIIFLALAALLAVLRAEEGGSPGRWAAAGLLLGLSAITWEPTLLFLPVLLLWMRGTPEPAGRRPTFPRRAGTLCLAVALTVLPVSARNWLAGGDVVLVSAWGGLNFYIGNAPATDRLTMIQPGEEWDDLVDLPASAAGVTRPSQRSRWFYREALAAIVDDPLAWLGRLGKKLVLFWNAAEFEPNNDLGYFRERSSVFRALYQPAWPVALPFGAVAPLALLGMFFAAREGRKARLLLGYALTFMTALVLFHVRARYRLPVVPVLLVFAAFAVDRIAGGAGRGWGWRRAGAHFAGLAALVALVNADFFAIRAAAPFPLHTTLGKINLAEGRLDEAREEFRAAVAADPKDYDAHVNLGVILERQGRGAEALASFRAALDAKPDYAVAHNDIGVWHFSRGMVEPAIAALQRAVALRPRYGEARYNLGVAYRSQGLLDRARAEFRTALEIDPGNAAARRAYEELARGG